MIRCDKSTRRGSLRSQGRAKGARHAAAPDRVRVLGGGVPGVRSLMPAARVGDIGGVLAHRGPRRPSEKISQNQSSLPTPGYRPPSKRSLAPVVAGF